MSALASVDPSSLSERGRLDLLAAWQAQTAWIEANAAAALVSHVGTGPLSHSDLTVTDDQDPAHLRLNEAALTLRTTERSLRSRYDVALSLSRRLPATAAALSSGEITWQHARTVAELTDPLPDGTAAQVEARDQQRAV